MGEQYIGKEVNSGMMGKMAAKNLTVYTVADPRYEPFVLPYIASILHHNPTAVVEIRLERPKQFCAENADALDIIDWNFPGRWVFSRGALGGIPHAMRFTTTPITQNEFVYIGDIDILILEEIAPPHLRHMAETGLPYSNMVRKGKTALTGLHFSRWDAFYPQAEPKPTTPPGWDEQILYEIVTARGLPLPPADDAFRPLHGYHISITRLPYSSEGPGWGGLTSKPFLEAYLGLREAPFWRELTPLFDRRYRQLLAMLDVALSATFPEAVKGRKPAPGTAPKDLW